MKAEVCIRSQHSVGSGGGFGGPDTYVAVIWSEEDSTEFPRCLNAKVLQRRGIHYEYIGEGYSDHRGPRSALGQWIARAEERRLELLSPPKEGE